MLVADREAVVVRPPGTSSVSACPRRTRRRGPRSMESRLSRSQALQRRIHCEGDLLCQSRSISPYSFDSFIIDLINIRGFVSHAAELNGHLKLNCYAQVFAINNTFLDKSLKIVSIPDFTLVSRRDRSDGAGGGRWVFADYNIASYIVLLRHYCFFKRS